MGTRKRKPTSGGELPAVEMVELPQRWSAARKTELVLYARSANEHQWTPAGCGRVIIAGWRARRRLSHRDREVEVHVALLPDRGDRRGYLRHLASPWRCRVASAACRSTNHESYFDIADRRHGGLVLALIGVIALG